MKDGFIRVAAATPDIHVADPQYNSEQIIELMEQGSTRGVKVMAFPELCLTAYTCSDLFLQESLLREAKKELKRILQASKSKDMILFVGMPWMHKGKLYNVAAVLNRGRILGIVPKKHLPNYSEFYELRHFNPGMEKVEMTDWEGVQVPMGMNLLFACRTMPELVLAAELCEDVWVPCPPSISHALAGATVIANCSASDETTGKDQYRYNLICGQSARLVCGYIYANAGEGESSQDLVFGGQNIIAENGTCLVQSDRFKNACICADLDLGRIISERRRMTTFRDEENRSASYETVYFELNTEDSAKKDSNKAGQKRDELLRYIDPAPFVPHDAGQRERRCEEILSIQAMGLKKRLAHTNCKHAVIGLSGGLDSTLALLVTVRAFDMLQIPRENIHCITMPCFGTTDRTYTNACTMAKKTGASLTEINIRDAVTGHFKDINHDIEKHDVTYENGQARERTQILMDIANEVGGMVIGTGDMSELALGWATYNGDHMSMYGVNASVPKTLVRHLVRYYADTCGEKELSDVLLDVLDTPVSPELLPPEDGKISQKTEDLVGPYELHDFYLYYVLRFGYSPAKIFRLALQAFEGSYDRETILKWLKTFYRRFFAQQFKRSCLPDGPKVGSVAVSPRGDLRMPSDACSRLWLKELEMIEKGER